MEKTDAQTVIEKLKEAVYFSICYKPKKYNGKPVYRNAKWDDKCKIGNGYIICYDRDRGGYRCASGESAISLTKGELNNGNRTNFRTDVKSQPAKVGHRFSI